MLENAEIPTREDVAQKLRQLIAGDLTPEAASDWASPWITRFHEIRGLDRKVRNALESLAGADMIVDTEGHRLYGRTDFVAWLRELTGESS